MCWVNEQENAAHASAETSLLLTWLYCRLVGSIGWIVGSIGLIVGSIGLIIWSIVWPISYKKKQTHKIDHSARLLLHDST